MDTLHHSAIENVYCTNFICGRSLLLSNGYISERPDRTVDEIKNNVKNFFEQYYSLIKQLNSESHQQRINEINKELDTTSTYFLKETELIFGAKLAWRNASRLLDEFMVKA